MKKITLILITLFLFAACGPTKRLERLLNRNPQLTAIDTITIHHETITPRIEFRERYITRPTDTIHIYQDKIEFKVIRQHDSIYIEIERPADTIRTEIKVPEELPLMAFLQVLPSMTLCTGQWLYVKLRNLVICIWVRLWVNLFLVSGSLFFL